MESNFILKFNKNILIKFSTLLFVLLFIVIPKFSFAATVYVNSSTGNDTTGDGSIGAPYATFHKGYTMANADDTLHLTGIFTLSSTTETGDAVTTGYTISKNLEILGAGADQTIIQSSTTTADRRVLTLANTATTTIRNLSFRNGRIGSFDGACILNNGTTTIINIEVYNCTSTGGYGGGIANNGYMDISSSSVYSNTTFYGGGGIAQLFNAGGNLIVTNNTIYGNRVTSTGGAYYGGGVYVGRKIVNLTNNTIVGNSVGTGLGGGVHLNTANAHLFLKNNLIAGNIATTYSTSADFYYSAGSITNNGYNIIGRAESYAWSTTGDWTDSNGDNTFVLNTVGTTGTLNLDTQLSLNDNANKTRTLGLLTGSIAINTGGSGTNSTTSIPSIDQRNASRNGSTDIGAFEYNGTGLSINSPSTQASNITFSLNQYNILGFNWTNGDGMRRTVFMKQGSSGTASPVDGTRYTGSTVFGNGDQIGSSGWYAVYDGYGTSTIVSNLNQNTSYVVHVTEYNGIGTGESKYNINSSTNNSNSATTYNPQTLYINTSTGNDSTGDGSTGAPYATFHKGYTMAQSGDTLNVSGIFDWINSNETGDVTINGYVISKDLNIIGQGAQNTFFQASSTDNTAERRIFTVSNSTTTITLKDLTLRYGKVASSANGGCYSSTASTTIQNVEMYNCRSTGGYGGAVYNGGYVNVLNSTFYDNHVHYAGGGIAAVTTATNTLVTNSTFYLNRVTASSGAFYGGGIFIGRGNASLTNNTITANTVTNGLGGGLQLYNTSNYVFMKNNLIASNTASFYTSTSDFHTYTANSNITSTYNIIGRAESYGWSSTGDWTDSNGDRTFVLNTAGTTGTVNFDSAASLGSSLTGTKTWPVLTSSIAINRGTTGGNGSTSVPSLDQRGAGRSGNTDIGAYEFGGDITDITGPVISSIASSTAYATATISWTTDENATSTVFYGTTQSFGSSSTTLTSATSQSFSLSGLSSNTLYYFYASSTDRYGNTSTSTTYTFLTTTAPDTTAPTISIISPTASEATSSTVTLVASATDNVSISGVKFYINGILQGSEDTTSPYSISWDSTATSSGNKILVATARDSSNNHATSSSVNFTVANTGVTPSSINVTSATNTATITWTTTDAASSKINFGPTTAYSSTTFEKDISPRVTSHTMTLVNLPRCALVNFIVVSRSTVDAATSSNNTFYTKGCVGGGNISSSQFGDITTTAGGSVTNDRITITVPTSFTSTSSAATFQAHKLDHTTFYSSAGSPTGKNRAGNNVYNLKALIDATTTLSTFSESLTISLSYTNSDVIGIDESSLKIYRYDGSIWDSLSNCSVNTSSNIVTCNTRQFSDFAIFGDESTDTDDEDISEYRARRSGSIVDRFHNLVMLGKVREANSLKSMWPNLFEDNVEVIEIKNETIKVQNPISNKEYFGTNLELKSENGDVKKLQEFLIQQNKGPAALELKRVGSSSYFGRYTQNALAEFQKSVGIKPHSGYFGPITRAYVNSLLF